MFPYPLFPASTYQQRRQKLRQLLVEEHGLVLIMGNNDSPMNYTHNAYPFRQDSNFLYFAGIQETGHGVLMDLDTGDEWLLADELSMDDIVWTGPQPSRTDKATAVGLSGHKALKDGYELLKAALQMQRPIHILPPYRMERTVLLATIFDCSPAEVLGYISVPLIEAVIMLRSYKEELEIQQMQEAVNISKAMHLAALQHCIPGKREANIAGVAEGIAIAAGGRLAYPCIATTRGEILHNHHHHRLLEEGQLLLLDTGASSTMQYAGDITRTFPVSDQFTTQQKEIYEIVLSAQEEAVRTLKEGIAFADVHQLAAQTLVGGLKMLGLMKGDAEEAVTAGAHALFFPHGLGHMIGLDVHDMEDLGEDRVGYNSQNQRSSLFGTSALRLGKKLAAGHTLTIEPGLYFIPALIDKWGKAGLHSTFINYDKLDTYRTFGGIRIEDNYLITKDGYELIGEVIPKTIDDIEAFGK